MWLIDVIMDWESSTRIYGESWGRVTAELAEHLQSLELADETLDGALDWIHGVVIEDEGVEVPYRDDEAGLTLGVMLRE